MLSKEIDRTEYLWDILSYGKSFKGDSTRLTEYCIVCCAHTNNIVKLSGDHIIVFNPFLRYPRTYKKLVFSKVLKITQKEYRKLFNLCRV